MPNLHFFMSNFKWSLNSSLWHQKCKRKGFTSIRKVFSLGKETENEKKSISTQKKSNSTSEEKYFYIEKKRICSKRKVIKRKENHFYLPLYCQFFFFGKQIGFIFMGGTEFFGHISRVTSISAKSNIGICVALTFPLAVFPR